MINFSLTQSFDLHLRRAADGDGFKAILSRVFLFPVYLITLVLDLVSPFAGPIVSKIFGYIPGGIFFVPDRSDMDKFFEQNELTKLSLSEETLLLTSGQRRAYAEHVAPPDLYPLMYRDVPEELDVGMIVDGRTLHGKAPAQTLPQQVLDDEVIETAWTHARELANVSGFVILLLSSVAGACVLTSAKVGGHVDAQSRIVAADAWSIYDAQASASTINTLDNVIGWISALGDKLFFLVALAMVLAGSYALAVFFAKRTYKGQFACAVYGAVESMASEIRNDAREALQRWRWRLETRDVSHKATAAAVDTIAEFDGSPVLRLGIAEGVTRFRGHLDAPLPQTPMRLSILDCTMHLCVLGATGEGKSRSFIDPFMSQLLDLRKQGYPIAIYLTDGKGELWLDLVREATQRGMQNDLRIIGTGQGQYRVDLLDGVDPNYLAEVIAGLGGQMGGEGKGDGFWQGMASALIRDVALVMRAWEITDQGQEFMKVRKVRPYSLKSIFGMCAFPHELEVRARQVADMYSVDEKDLSPAAKDYKQDSLFAAVKSVLPDGFWLTLANETRSGVVANVRHMLKEFVYNDALAGGFGDGYQPDGCAGMLKPAEILANNLTAINIDAIRFGLGGKLTNILLKAFLFKAARESQTSNPMSSKDRLDWWSKPDLGQVKPHHTMTFFIADEYQDLAHGCSGAGAGLSDEKFWNIARTSSVVGVVVSQGRSAYQMVLGNVVADNFLQNFRTQIVLRTEDKESIDHAIKLAGKTVRFESANWEQFESDEARRREKRIPDSFTLKEGWLDGVEWSWEVPSMDIKDYNTGYSYEYEVSDHEQFSSRTREEDKREQMLERGRQETSVLNESDLMSMGRGRAVVFTQRAGVTRVDVCHLGA